MIAVAKGRANRSALGIAYIPKKTKSFEAELRWHWTRSKNKMIPAAPTTLMVLCLLPRPKTIKKGTVIPITRPDVDNYAKSIMDGLSGYAWKDDNQITTLIISKRFAPEGSHPKIVVNIYPDTERGDI